MNTSHTTDQNAYNNSHKASIFNPQFVPQFSSLNSQQHSPFIVEEKPRIIDSMSDDTSDDEVDEIFPLMTNNTKGVKMKKKYWWILGLLIGISAIIIIFTLIIIVAFVYFIIDGN